MKRSIRMKENKMRELERRTHTRVRNFTQQEKAEALEIIKKHRILYTRETENSGHKEKRETWKRVTAEFNALAGHSVERSADQLRKLWENIKFDYKRKMLAQNKDMDPADDVNLEQMLQTIAPDLPGTTNSDTFKNKFRKILPKPESTQHPNTETVASVKSVHPHRVGGNVVHVYKNPPDSLNFAATVGGRLKEDRPNTPTMRTIKRTTRETPLSISASQDPTAIPSPSHDGRHTVDAREPVIIIEEVDHSDEEYDNFVAVDQTDEEYENFVAEEVDTLEEETSHDEEIAATERKETESQEKYTRKRSTSSSSSRGPGKRSREAMQEDIISCRKALMNEEHEWKREEFLLRRDLLRQQINESKSKAAAAVAKQSYYELKTLQLRGANSNSLRRTLVSLHYTVNNYHHQ